MPIYTVRLTTPIRPTFRTHQVAGLFDLSLDDLAGERFAHTLTAELPGLDEDWTIGAIVGPSGSGKTTLARAAYGAALHNPEPWPDDVALIDALEQAFKAPTIGRGVEPTDILSRQTFDDGQFDLPTTLTSGQGFDSHRATLKEMLRVLTAVGLASPPSWLKPYRVLSTGERFRADLARAILSLRISDCELRIDGAHLSANPHSEIRNPQLPPLLVFDEFTSTLDRTVACTASFALAKYLRSSASNPKSEIPNPKFLCLSCHTDFLPWLAPDWILDLGECRPLTPSGPGDRKGVALPSTSTNESIVSRSPVPHGVRGLPCVRPSWPRKSRERRELRLEIRRVKQRIWLSFARHHYLTGGLSTAATCYGAFLNEDDGHPLRIADCGLRIAKETLSANPQSEIRNPQFLPIAFCAVLATLGHRRTKRITRLVVLPEFQGLGIGPRLAESVAALEAAKGNRVTITASHPSILAWCSRSPRWKYLGLKKTGSTCQKLATRTIRSSTGRAVASFEFVREGEPPREGEAPAEP